MGKSAQTPYNNSEKENGKDELADAHTYSIFAVRILNFLRNHNAK